MAERRMFAKTVIDSDAFLDMPLSAQALYFHLSMRADDDGFINNPKKIQRMIGASDDDCKLLIMKRFVITFESGVIVIKHWKIHNYIRSDRYKPTIYKDEKSRLIEKDNKAYTEIESGNFILGIPNDNQTDTQVRLGKVSTGKDNLIDQPQKRFTKPTLEEVQAYCQERNNNVNAERFIDYYTAKGWKIGKNPMKDWKAAVRTWEKNNFDKPAQETPQEANPGFDEWMNNFMSKKEGE